jgi:hypothetical protein
LRGSRWPCTSTGKYVAWDRHSSKIIGLCDDDKELNVVGAEYERLLASKLREASLTEPEKSPSERAATKKTPYATRSIVFFWTSLGAIKTASGDPVAFQAARWATSSETTGSLETKLNAVMCSLYQYGFDTAAVCCDGASENHAIMKLLMEVNGSQASEFIPASITSQYTTLDFSWKVAFGHPITFSPVFFIPDTPHLLKKLRNSLDASGRGLYGDRVDGDGLQIGNHGHRHTRDLKMPTGASEGLFHDRYHTMSLRMLKRVVDHGRLDGDFRVTTNKFTHVHFHLTNSLKMRVKLAAHVLSTTMANLIKSAQDTSMDAGLDFRNEPSHTSYGPLLELVTTVDTWWDVVNSASPKGFRPIEHDDLAAPAGSSQLHTLLQTLQFFQSWKDKLKDSDLCPGEKECSFITKEQWDEMQWVCLGLVGVCHHLLRDHPNRKVVFRRFQSDVVEHHFGNRRTFSRGVGGGSHIMATCEADAVSSASRTTNFCSDKGNSTVRKDVADVDSYGIVFKVAPPTLEQRQIKRRKIDSKHLRVDEHKAMCS